MPDTPNPTESGKDRNFHVAKEGAPKGAHFDPRNFSNLGPRVSVEVSNISFKLISKPSLGPCGLFGILCRTPRHDLPLPFTARECQGRALEINVSCFFVSNLGLLGNLVQLRPR